MSDAKKIKNSGSCKKNCNVKFSLEPVQPKAELDKFTRIRSQKNSIKQMLFKKSHKRKMINLYSFVPVMKKTNKRMKTKKRLRTKLNNLLNVVYRFMFTSSPENNKRVKFNYANFIILLPICFEVLHNINF